MNWISVKDEYPNDRERVLCVGPRGGMQICRFARLGERIEFQTVKQGIMHVTHWQRLPEPPMEEA